MDEKELETWLKTRSREDAILIAQRAALRVWPVWGASRQRNAQPESDWHYLTVSRCFLTAGVARMFRMPELNEAYDNAVVQATAAAYAAAFANNRAAALAAHSAATRGAATRYANARAASLADESYVAAAAASYSDARRAAIWSNTEQDVLLLQSRGDLLRAQLWHSDVPVFILELEQIALETLARETGNRNSFWHQWYESAKRDEWLDWELQKAVALLSEDIWKLPPSEVDREIAKIEAEFATRVTFSSVIDATPNSEVIERDELGNV